MCDLAELAEVSQPTVSHHLKVLKNVGLLDAERRGTWVWYRINPARRSAVTALLDAFAPAAIAEAARPRHCLTRTLRTRTRRSPISPRTSRPRPRPCRPRP